MKFVFDPDYDYEVDKDDPNYIWVRPLPAGEPCRVTREIATAMQTMAKSYYRLTVPEKAKPKEETKKSETKEETREAETAKKDQNEENDSDHSDQKETFDILLAIKNSIKNPLSYDASDDENDGSDRMWLMDQERMENQVETSILLRDLISSLTEKQLAVYQECVEGGKSVPNFAQEHNVTPRAIRYQMAAIRKKAKKFFGDTSES